MRRVFSPSEQGPEQISLGRQGAIYELFSPFCPEGELANRYRQLKTSKRKSDGEFLFAGGGWDAIQLEWDLLPDHRCWWSLNEKVRLQSGPKV